MWGEITPSRHEVNRAIATHTHMRQQLVQRRKWITSTLVTGSYKRKTAIRPLNDVDIFAIVSPIWAQSRSPAEIQKEVQKVLQEIYPKTAVHRPHHALFIGFSSQKIGYDVLPAVPTENYYKVVHIDSEDGQFIAANPKAIEDAKQDANRQGGWGGRMIRMIRLMKHWNRKNNKKLKSIHLELLCYRAASIMASCSSDRESCAALLEFLSTEVFKDCYDPGVPLHGDLALRSNLRDSRTPEQLSNIAGELGAAARKARNALACETTNPSEAHGLWEELFGDDVY